MLLGIATSSLYIGTDISEINLDFKTGDTYPIKYEYRVTNIGSERARFDISSDTPWIFVYKEYEPALIVVELLPGEMVIFIIEVRAEQAPDGVHGKTVTVKAANPLSSENYETVELGINIRKNVDEARVTPELTEEPSPTTTVSPAETVEPTPTEQHLPTVEPTPTSLISKTPTPTPIPMDEPSAGDRRSIWSWFWNFVRGRLF
jgi:hypothetical protein